jgi:SAM-dependent methyltransferase
MRVDLLYAARFDRRDEAFKVAVWRLLWRSTFSRWIRPEDVLLDVGAGYCELSNVAVARRRIAVDLNPRLADHAQAGVEIHVASADRLDFIQGGEVDVAFSSNFFEHLPTKEALSRVFQEIHRVLRPGGLLIAMGPNVRKMPGSYWDFYDHHLALSERSLAEGLAMAGFSVEQVHPGYFPATTKSRLPRWPWLVAAYLALRPVLAPLVGKQFLLLARKPQAPAPGAVEAGGAAQRG